MSCTRNRRRPLPADEDEGVRAPRRRPGTLRRSPFRPPRLARDDAAVIEELPGLRQGVRALRGRRGLLLHDPLRWRLFSVPAGLPADKLSDFLRESGLD